MKKITLVLLLALTFSKTIFGQAGNIILKAPKYDGNTSPFLGPNGYGYPASSPTVTYAYNRACYLITADEMARFVQTNSVITNFGFDFFRPGSVPITGTFNLYLENTADITYTKGTNFATIIAPMVQHYGSNMTLPGSTSPATTQVSVPLSSSFTWTGGGLYVAFDWHAATATSTNIAYYLACNDGTVSMGANASAPVAGPAPATLTLDPRRPQMRFTLGNRASNDVGITRLDAPGIVSKLMVPGHPVTAQIINTSTTALTNVPVTLKVTGANTFNDVQTVSTIAAGGTANVVFNPFSSPVSGINDLDVSVPVDQDTNNNHHRYNWSQVVGCADYANNYPVVASDFSDGSYGYSGQAIIATPMTIPSQCTITSVKFAPSTNSTSSSICGVLTDATGGILAMTNTITVNGSTSAFLDLKFTPGDPNTELLQNTIYYVGIAQLTGATYPFGTFSWYADYDLNLYYTIPITGGSVGNAQNHMGYVGIQAALVFSTTAITAAPSRTLYCKQDPAVTFTAALGGSGTSTFTWTPGGLQGASVVITPTVSGTNTLATYSVTGTDVTSGCKSVAAKVTVVVSSCVGLADNTSNGYNVNVFPNPAVNGKATVSGLVGTNTIVVYNTLGQIVLKQTVSSESANLDLSGQASGNYVVKITDSDSQTRIIKVVNQN